MKTALPWETEFKNLSLSSSYYTTEDATLWDSTFHKKLNQVDDGSDWDYSYYFKDESTLPDDRRKLLKNL